MIPQYALCRSVGSGIPFSLGEGGDAVTVLLEPMRIRDWGVLEQMLLLRRKQETMLGDLDETAYEALKETLKTNRSVPVEDLFSYASTQEGATWRLWLSLRGKYSHCQCVQWVDTLAGTKRLGDYLVCAAQADGIDLFASLDWPVLPYQEELETLRKHKKSGVVDWKLHMSALAELYNLSPAQIGELTVYQVRLLLWDREALQGKISMTPDEHRDIIWMRKAKRSSVPRRDELANAIS